MEAKTEDFNILIQNAAASAKLLAHPARMAILEFLMSRDVCFSGDISREIPLSRPTIHQHLQALKDAGWIQGSISGSKISYCVNDSAIQEQTKELSQFLDKCKNRECVGNSCATKPC